MSRNKPAWPILASGVLELVGKDEEINTNDMSAEAEYELPASEAECSGTILSVGLYAAETGDGAVLTSAGQLLVFDSDPGVTSGDTSLTDAVRKTQIGAITVASTAWQTIGASGFAYVTGTEVPFQACDKLYFVWLHTDEQDINDAAGHDETLSMRFWYRKES